ncbi:hypothetical protein COCNU_scaffold052174G000010 [Cocos nucifera]|nr:hypothetical protein [Cocos nucifera]
MGFSLVDKEDQERERGRSRDEKVGRKGSPKCYLAFTPAPRWVTHSSASEEQSEHTPSTSTSTAQGPLPSTSTSPTTEPLPSPISETHATMQASECASSSQIFHGPTHMAHVWNHQHQVMVYYDAEERSVGETAQKMHSFFGVLVRLSDIIFIEPKDWHLMDYTVRDWRRYDFFDHERARDTRLRKIGELYRSYKIKLHRGWLEHQ